jgi:hypothetical protein
MKFRLPVVSFLFVLAGVASAADPQLLKLVMPDAKVVSGIDVDRVKGTPFGRFLISQLPVGDAQFQEFVSATGFDPLRDLHEVVMASPADMQAKSGLLLARGRFDSQRILSLFRADGKTPELYHGVSILSGGGHGHTVSQALAFLDDSTVVAGDAASVRSAIDRRSGSTQLGAALLDKINRSSAVQDAWLISTAPISTFAPAMPDRNVKGALNGDLIKAIEQSSGGIKFGNTIDISGELTARTDKDAASLADVVKFFLSMATMNGNGGGAAQFASLLQNLTVSAEANAVKLFVSIPENELETLIKLSGRAPGKAPRI